MSPIILLIDATDRFWRTLEAVTVPIENGRKIPDFAGAIALSEAASDLMSALFQAHKHTVDTYAQPLNQPPHMIQFHQSDSPDGPWEPIPPGEISASIMSIGAGGAPAVFIAAFHRAAAFVSHPPERHGARRRYQAGDILLAEDIESLRSVGRLLRIEDDDSSITSLLLEAGQAEEPVTDDAKRLLGLLRIRSLGGCVEHAWNIDKQSVLAMRPVGWSISRMEAALSDLVRTGLVYIRVESALGSIRKRVILLSPVFVDDTGWPTLSEAERATGVNRGVISKACDHGKLKDNGKKQRDRRVDPADLVRWTEERATKPAAGESDAAVRRKLPNDD